ncbi:MAG: undecaprenyl-phosphate glucose phosphotransferase [Gammaproteobacteria bacterium]|nr:undecaprenyl-phosphate glucose phosphotransferase [Gammaproteobacteria bacterium]MBV8306968.1 undecaprenyl-phosphate glucose phosphotransferase [Gammaproteobacteria bacterium]
MASVIQSVPSRRVRLGRIEPAAVAVLTRLDPVIVAAGLIACQVLSGRPLTSALIYLALLAFVLASPLFGSFDLPHLNSNGQTALSSLPAACSRVLVRWGAIVAALLFFMYAFKAGEQFSRKVVFTWFAFTPMALCASQAMRLRADWFAAQTAMRRYIIVGVNDVGLELARRLPAQGFSGYFDFRSPDRVSPLLDADQFAGHCRDLADYVRAHSVGLVYIALPLANVPRLGALINALRDTTASVYFVPDAFAFDLIQGRVGEVNGMPVLSVCDTPFHGTDAVVKRTMDILFGACALLLALPLLVVIAAAVKLSSPGPVLFRQRRYGLNGEEITVYKFRSMTVCEDGPVVTQATARDDRVTGIGRLIRRTSLDELPQLFNVLQGTMSLVGPRPHAVAHNEKYRRLINGYMIRHKVRPGITGLAQMHGLRGETDTVEKMAARVRYDLEYLRNWSPWLDIKILVKSLGVVWKDYKSTY